MTLHGCVLISYIVDCRSNISLSWRLSSYVWIHTMSKYLCLNSTWHQGRNLGTCSATHPLSFNLNWLILTSTLNSIGNLFHCSDALKVKLFLTTTLLLFSTMMPPTTCLLVLLKMAAKYSGWPLCLILCTLISVWYTINWFTVSQLSLSYMWSLCDLGGIFSTIWAALFCWTCKDFTCTVQQPPKSGRQ